MVVDVGVVRSGPATLEQTEKLAAAEKARDEDRLRMQRMMEAMEAKMNQLNAQLSASEAAKAAAESALHGLAAPAPASRAAAGPASTSMGVVEPALEDDDEEDFSAC